MTKHTNWQQRFEKNGPLAGALLFGVLLSFITIWYTRFAIGPTVSALGLGAALAIVGFTKERTARLIVPILLALAALGLAAFAGGLIGPAIAAILWPVLAMANYSDVGARKAQKATGLDWIGPDWMGSGIGASLGVLVGLALIGGLISLPNIEFINLHSAILALGTCAAMAIGALVARRRQALSVHLESPDGEAALQQANQSRDAALLEAQQARKQTRDRAQFMAEMSHEIRTPLNAILGFADTMRAQVFGPLPAAYGDYPDLIHTSGTHLLDVVSDLLDLSKIEAGRYETNLKSVQLDELASEGVALSGGAARTAGVQLRHEATGPASVLGDARALRQVIFNLVSNGIKFTPTGGRVVIRVLTDPANGTASLEVEDNGVGMKEADLLRIGQPWNQVSEAEAKNNKRARGSGLGLALVKRLAELQGGQFHLSSTLGVGTKAVVTLPLAPTSATAPTPPASS